MEDHRLRLVVLSNIIGLLAAFTNSISINVNEPDKANLGVSAKLLYGDSAGISWSDMEVSERLAPLLTAKGMKVIALDYHYKHGLVFFSAWGNIYVANIITGEDPGVLTERRILVEGADARSLAVDWTRDHLYWATEHSLHRANLDGSGARVELHRRPGAIRGVVLDPYARLIFVAEAGEAWTYDLRDGSTRCLRLGRMRVVGLALSPRMRRLFVSARAGGSPRLYSSEYDGSDMLEYRIDREWWRELVTIAVFRDHIFWIHRGWEEKDTVWKAKVATNGSISWDLEFVARGSSAQSEININTVAVYHPETQDSVKYRDDAGEFQDNANAEESITRITFFDGRCQEAITSDGSKPLPCITCFAFMYLIVFVCHTF